MRGRGRVVNEDQCVAPAHRQSQPVGGVGHGGDSRNGGVGGQLAAVGRSRLQAGDQPPSGSSLITVVIVGVSNFLRRVRGPPCV
jgi:hypothetical protein